MRATRRRERERRLGGGTPRGGRGSEPGGRGGKASLEPVALFRQLAARGKYPAQPSERSCGGGMSLASAYRRENRWYRYVYLPYPAVSMTSYRQEACVLLPPSDFNLSESAIHQTVLPYARHESTSRSCLYTQDFRNHTLWVLLQYRRHLWCRSKVVQEKDQARSQEPRSLQTAGNMRISS